MLHGLRETITATRKAIQVDPRYVEVWNKNILAIEKLIKEIEADKNPAPVRVHRREKDNHELNEC